MIMRVLQINCVYKFGSTGKIVYDLHSVYRDLGIESYVCYGRGEQSDDVNVYKTSREYIAKSYNLLSRFTGIQYGGAYGATKRLFKKIDEINPDIVHLHCINGFFVNIYELLEYLKRNNIKTVLTLHAEFMYTGSCGYALDCEQWMTAKGCIKCPQLREATGSYFLDRTHAAWNLMKNAFADFKNLIVVSVSPWLKNRAEKSEIMKKMKHTCILNGIDTKNTFLYIPESEGLRTRLGLENKKVVLYVCAAFSAFKGANYILQLAEKMPDITFVVVGNKGDIGEHPKNILPVGRVENQKELAEYYSMADMTVLTSKRETFSMICAESLACGTPVVGFFAGAPETISIPEYSKFCTYGDVQALINIIKETYSNLNQTEKENISALSRDYYSKKRMAEEYLRVYKELYDEG